MKFRNKKGAFSFSIKDLKKGYEIQMKEKLQDTKFIFPPHVWTLMFRVIVDRNSGVKHYMDVYM